MNSGIQLTNEHITQNPFGIDFIDDTMHRPLQIIEEEEENDPHSNERYRHQDDETYHDLEQGDQESTSPTDQAKQ